MWLYASSFCNIKSSHCKYELSNPESEILTIGRILYYGMDIEPHIDTLYNIRKSTFQLSNVAKYGHGFPEDGFKGDQNL